MNSQKKQKPFFMKGQMMNVLNWLSGKRTYVVAAAMVALGVAEGMGWLQTPEWVWGVVAGLGFGFLRAGVSQISQAVQQAKEQSK